MSETRNIFHFQKTQQISLNLQKKNSQNSVHELLTWAYVYALKFKWTDTADLESIKS